MHYKTKKWKKKKGCEALEFITINKESQGTNTNNLLIPQRNRFFFFFICYLFIVTIHKQEGK